MKVLLVGGGAREHAMAEALARSNSKPKIFAWMKNVLNPGIEALAHRAKVGLSYYDILVFAEECQVDLAIIGQEEQLHCGIVDALEEMGIATVGPKQELARLETSKSFARALMEKYHIPGCPKFAVFKTTHHLEKYFNENMPVVLKPDGLTGGKGVMVQGEHFETTAEALKICKEILAEHQTVVIEEKLEGEEFSLQCFCDGLNVAPMPPVYDHKRLFVGDTGPNTGSMGSYSCACHLLPFLAPDELNRAVEIVRQTTSALLRETGWFYRGIICGGFMVTADGVKLIEFNTRFGDPEAINVLPIMETDFLEVCQAVVECTLNRLNIKFKPLATTVKYVVPVNYGLPEDQRHLTSSDIIRIGNLGKAKLYYASVYRDKTELRLTSSRALAVLGISPDLAEAEKIADQAACNIAGPVTYRPDIGTTELIAKQVRHMKRIRRK